MTVDAHAAQHVGPDAPSIGPAFALIGLYLAVERGLSGPQVRETHHLLATPKREWPRFEPPLTAWPVTVRDVAAPRRGSIRPARRCHSAHSPAVGPR